MAIIDNITIVCLIGAIISILTISWFGLCIVVNKLTKGRLEKTLLKLFKK